MSGIPDPIRGDLSKARALCGWTLVLISAVALMMYLVMGQSQAMKSAFIEDVLSLIPSFVFLVAASVEGKPRSERFPFGFKRFDSLAFLIAATALLSIGAFIAKESITALLSMEHPSIGMVEIFGQRFWLGYAMIAALLISAIPPIVLGRLKMPVAKRLADKVLYTDAETQKADWQTALVGVLGIVGIGFGLWWADSAAALFISLSVMKDGWTNLKKASAELGDGAPRALESNELSSDAEEIAERLRSIYPMADIRLRESGRYIYAEVVGEGADKASDIELVAPHERKWRLVQVSYVPASSHRE